MTSQRNKITKNKTSPEKEKTILKIKTKTKTARGANIVRRTKGRREGGERGRWNDEEEDEEDEREWMEGREESWGMEDEEEGWEEEADGGERRRRGGGGVGAEEEEEGGDGGRKVSRNRRSLGAGSVAKRKHQRNHRCTMGQNQVILRHQYSTFPRARK